MAGPPTLLDALWRATADERFVAPQLEGALSADLAIVGGGFTGCAAALAAAEAGLSVALLEAETIGHGGSGRNVGLVNAGLWLPPEALAETLGAGPAARLTTALAGAPDRVFGLIERHQIQCEATRRGTLHLAHAASGLRDLENRRRQLSALGAPVTLLSAEETARRTGTEAYRGALHDARAGVIQPLSYCRGLARAAVAAGARLFERSAVRRVRRETARRGSAPDAGGAWLIETPEGGVRAPRLMVAANAYAAGLRGAAPPATATVDYFQIATAPAPPGDAAKLLPGGEGCWDTAPVMSSFRRDRPGRLILGAIGSLESVGAAVHRAWAARALRRLYPTLGALAIEHAWSGRISMTRDHTPKILRLGPAAFAVFGYSGRGIGPGTLFGQAVAAALATGDENALPIAPTDAYHERLAGAKSVVYEAGATLAHWTGHRRG